MIHEMKHTQKYNSRYCRRQQEIRPIK
jgi:hypothetical protein